MHFEGIVAIQAPREKVWNFLTDPKSVSQCAPGIKSVDVIIPDKKFRAVAAVGFGSISTTFDNEIEFVELIDLEFAKVRVHGKAPGSAVDALGEMKLSDGEGGATNLNWSAEITIVGTIASLASRMLGGVTKKLTGAFFNCLKEKIEE